MSMCPQSICAQIREVEIGSLNHSVPSSPESGTPPSLGRANQTSNWLDYPVAGARLSSTSEIGAICLVWFGGALSASASISVGSVRKSLVD